LDLTKILIRAQVATPCFRIRPSNASDTKRYTAEGESQAARPPRPSPEGFRFLPRPLHHLPIRGAYHRFGPHTEASRSSFINDIDAAGSFPCTSNSMNVPARQPRRYVFVHSCTNTGLASCRHRPDAQGLLQHTPESFRVPDGFFHIWDQRSGATSSRS